MPPALSAKAPHAWKLSHMTGFACQAATLRLPENAPRAKANEAARAHFNGRRIDQRRSSTAKIPNLEVIEGHCQAGGFNGAGIERKGAMIKGVVLNFIEELAVCKGGYLAPTRH